MGFIQDAYIGLGGRLFGGRFRQALSLIQSQGFANGYINSKTAIFIDMDNLLAVFQGCPHLQIVLNKQAEMLSNGCLKMRKKSNKEEIEKHWALTFMKNPNPLQSQREFIYEWSLYQNIYSNNFIYTLRPFPKSQPKTITNLPSGLMRIIPTGKWLDQTDLSGIIDRYIMAENLSASYTSSIVREFDTTEVVHTNTGLSRSPLVSDSKFIALQMPISNIVAAYKTRNILINENAGMTIISSGGSSDGDGKLPLGDTERKRIETAMRQDFGLQDNKMHKIIASSPLSVVPLVFPVDQMKLFEEVEEDFSAICGAFGMDRDLFPSLKGATFENKKNGEIATYNGIVQTVANTFCNFLDLVLLGTEDAEFYMDYSHLACMQSDKKTDAEARKLEAETNKILFDAGIISDDAYAEMMDVEMTGKPTQKNDSLGRIPLALQQLALARERANTAGDVQLSNSIGAAMDKLTIQMVASVTNNTN